MRVVTIDSLFISKLSTIGPFPLNSAQPSKSIVAVAHSLGFTEMADIC